MSDANAGVIFKHVKVLAAILILQKKNLLNKKKICLKMSLSVVINECILLDLAMT